MFRKNPVCTVVQGWAGQVGHLSPVTCSPDPPYLPSVTLQAPSWPCSTWRSWWGRASRRWTSWPRCCSCGRPGPRWCRPCSSTASYTRSYHHPLLQARNHSQNNYQQIYHQCYLTDIIFATFKAMDVFIKSWKRGEIVPAVVLKDDVLDSGMDNFGFEHVQLWAKTASDLFRRLSS